jgi:phosphatidyl-myo-inositol dimannoside synthase
MVLSKRICLLSSEFPPICGGIGVFAFNLARGLADIGSPARVITTVPPIKRGGMQRRGGEGLDVCYGVASLNVRYVKAISLLGKALQSFRSGFPNTLVAMAWTHDGLVAYLLGKLLQIDYAVVIHGSEINSHRDSKMPRRLMEQVLRGARWLIANSEYTRRQAIDLGISASKIHVLHPPVAPPSEPSELDISLDERLRIEPTSRVLLTAGRLFPRKGHAQVLHLLAELRDRYPDLHYVITGEGEYRRTLERLAEDLEISDRVRFLGFISEEELHALYRRCIVYISPSDDDHGDVEGFGIAFAEAGMHGKPVLAGRSGGVEEAVRDEQTGLLVNPRDHNDLRSALVRLLDSPGLRDELGKQAKHLVETELGLEIQAQRLLQILFERA